MNRLEEKNRRRLKRKIHIRKAVSGTAEKPRLTVYKSSRYLYLQAIDDVRGHTLAAASNLEKDLRGIKSTVAEAVKLGEVMGKRLKEKKILVVVFDRNGYSYHGVVKALADGTRKAGIRF